MTIYTIGFTERPASDFFETLKRAGVKRLVDIRLKPSSQLAGFAKREHLPYLLKEICGAEYVHEPLLAPTDELLDDFKAHRASWEEYERRFLQIMEDREVEEKIDRKQFEAPTVFLCSERTPDECHRRLAVEYLGKKWGGVEAVHL